MSFIDTVFGAIGGLGLFLYGMGILSDGLKMVAGNSLRTMMERITKWPALAMLIGAGATVLIQSSSATTVIVVGLINAGLLSLKQSISVVLGANVGTTCTAWIVGAIAGFEHLKITTYTLPAIGIGFAIQMFGRKARIKHLGQIILGFGILFVGISFMKDAFEPLGKNESVESLLIWIGGRPLLAVLAGAAITMLLQSSSASIAMLQTLAVSGAFVAGGEITEENAVMVLKVAIPFVLGDNIGTTITAQIAALRTNINGKRAAMGHTVFNVVGVALILPFVYLGWYPKLVHMVAPWGPAQIGLSIALAHTLFNVTAAIAVLPFVGWVGRLVTWMLPQRKTGRLSVVEPVTLETHLLDTPYLAMGQARRELVRMTQTAKDAVDAAAGVTLQNDREQADVVTEREQTLDTFQTEITRYLVELSKRELEPEMSNELPVLMHTVNDLERIGDHATNIVEMGLRKLEQHYGFTEEAQQELEAMHDQIHQMFEHVLLAVRDDDRNVAREALVHERQINQMQVDYRRTHGERLAGGRCNPLVGMSFVDCVDNFEKIGDHLANIAQGVIVGLQWGVMDDEIVSGKYHADQQQSPPGPSTVSAQEPATGGQLGTHKT